MKEQIIKEFSPRRFGKLQPMLLEFYKWCKEKKSAVFAMPEGNIYSQKAHDNILQAHNHQLSEKIEGIIEEFEEEISIDGKLRYSTRVEPRLCDAEKTKGWLQKRFNQLLK